MTGIVVFAHGSSVESANEGVRRVAAGLPYGAVEAAFLEAGKPDLAAAVEILVSRGATRIVVIPYFLTLGIHLQRDLPGIVGRIAGIHKDVSIEVTAPLEGHPALLEILCERATEALRT